MTSHGILRIQKSHFGHYFLHDLFHLRRAYTDSATYSRLVRDLKKTEIAKRLQRSRKCFLEAANQSPIEIRRELSFEHAQKTGRN